MLRTNKIVNGFGGGGFNSCGSGKGNVDNYYSYKQTSDGGGSGIPSRGGSILSTIVIVIIVALIINT